MNGLLDFRQRLNARPRTTDEWELVVDNFAGAGGASLGIEAAIGRAVDIAVNHDPLAVETHKANHPNTKHYTQDVWEVDPVEVCEGRPVGLAWFSPDCKHFSRAKGGKPVSKRVRSLAWVVVKWAKLVKPRVIMLENVTEFQDWGPLGADQKPIPSRKGETFRRWLGMLERSGYKYEYRTLVAADYGVPTIRKRFFLIARCDGETIVWPTRTHWPRKERTTNPKTWRPAAECIDWDLPCPSIFERKRPLADATLRRVARGLHKFVLDAADPFIVTCNHQGEGFRGQGLDEPMMTITGSRDANGLVVPTMVQTGYGEREGQYPRSLDLNNPIGTLVGSNKHALVEAFLAGVGGRAGQSKPRTPKDPYATITAKADTAVVSVFLNKHYGGVTGQDLEDPAGTITAKDHHSLTQAWFIKLNAGSHSTDLKDPLSTQTTRTHDGLMTAFLDKYYGTCRHGADMRDPVPTVTGGGLHVAEVRAFLVKYFGTGTGQDLRDPAHTLTGKHRLGLVLVKGQWYQIVDICLRMLTPKELLRAQFGRFATSYVLVGNQSQQVKGIGNSVCPELAEALVKANVKLRRAA